MRLLVASQAAFLLLSLTPPAAALSTTSTSSSARHMAVPFVEDDYAKALADGRARKLPIFVEVWAPW